MRYYTIQENDSILIANNEQALTRFYDNVYLLPEDYEVGKYIVGEVEEEIEVPDYDEDGNPIIIEYEDTEVVVDYDENFKPIGTHEITVIKHRQQTHTETITRKGLVLNHDWEEEQAEKERIRIANLHMTRGDVFRGLLLAKGVTRADMRGLIEAMPETTPQEKIAKEYALIDFDEALEFYRGVSLIDTVGAQLGISSVQMDRFFDTKDWHELLNEEEVNV